MYPLLVLTTAERTSAAVADRMIGFQAAASALGAAVIPPLIGLAMGVSAGAFRASDRTAVPDRSTAVHSHADAPTPLAMPARSSCDRAEAVLGRAVCFGQRISPDGIPNPRFDT